MTTDTGAFSASRRARAKSALAEYPHLEPSRLDDLLHWIKKEASALEIAILSSDPKLADPYRELRKDHLDTLSIKDWARFLVLFFGTAAVLTLFIWWVR